MNLEPSTSNERPEAKPSRRGRWVLVLLASMLALSVGFLALVAYVSGAGRYGFMPPQMAAAYHTPQDLVGDLGGMPVRIDRHIVRLVEYDGDPGWGEKRQNPPPERSHASRLASLGFYVRYPDMRSLDEPQMRDDFDRYHPIKAGSEDGLKEKDPWLDGGIESGTRYPGDGSLNRLYKAMFNPALRSPNGERVAEPSPVNGLELFIHSGNDPLTGSPLRYETSGGGDIYIYRDPKGNVTTYIRCFYRSGTKRLVLCEQMWSLESQNVGALVTVMYRPGLLPQWQDIQTKVSRFVLDFRDKTTTPTVKQ